MRRALAWGWVCLLALFAGILILGHLSLESASIVFRMSAPEAALRIDERMEIVWPSGSVNPNTASAELLETLPHIGPALAQRIIDEREQNGLYVFPEDLLSVNGIGEKTLARIRDYLFLPPLQLNQ